MATQEVQKSILISLQEEEQIACTKPYPTQLALTQSIRCKRVIRSSKKKRKTTWSPTKENVQKELSLTFVQIKLSS